MTTPSPLDGNSSTPIGSTHSIPDSGRNLSKTEKKASRISSVIGDSAKSSRSIKDRANITQAPPFARRVKVFFDEIGSWLSNPFTYKERFTKQVNSVENDTSGLVMRIEASPFLRKTEKMTLTEVLTLNNKGSWEELGAD